MESLTERLDALGRKVAATSDLRSDPTETLGLARDRVFDATRTWRTQGRPPWAIWLLGTAAAVVPMLLMIHFDTAKPSISYAVEGINREPAASFIETDEDSATVRFAEGSVVIVSPETGMRVLQTRPHGVTLSVEHGQVRCNVVHQHATEWMVRAGPFEIRVTGTQFDTQWQPRSGRFELAMLEGSVEVSGPEISGAQHVRAGERLVIDTSEGTKTLTGNGGTLSLGSEPRENGDAGKCDAGLERTPSTDAAVVSHVDAKPRSAPTWQGLAESGRHSEAMSQIRAAGIDAVIEGSDVATLRLLADTLRIAGAPKLAQQVLSVLRDKYGTRGETAFILGKIAADHFNAPVEALEWFETYLLEEPSGALREQALGRCLELEQNVGGQHTLERARQYLDTYPSGVFATLAEETLARSSGSAPR